MTIFILNFFNGDLKKLCILILYLEGSNYTCLYKNSFKVLPLSAVDKILKCDTSKYKMYNFIFTRTFYDVFLLTEKKL